MGRLLYMVTIGHVSNGQSVTMAPSNHNPRGADPNLGGRHSPARAFILG
jgi:hypothetical protein